MVRQEYSPEFSLEMGIFKRENSLDPSELVLVCEQLYDDEGDPRYKDKQNKIMQRKVNSIYDTSGYRILNVCWLDSSYFKTKNITLVNVIIVNW